MRLVPFLFIVQIFGSALNANPAAILAGEHEGFTRLVIYAEDNSNWTATHSGPVISVSFSDPEVTFETKDVFDRIGRNRIKSVSATEGKLEVTTNCACNASIYGSPPGLIVLDIASKGVNLKTPLIKKSSSRATSDMSEGKAYLPGAAQISKNWLTLNQVQSTDAFQTSLTSGIGNLSSLGILKNRTEPTDHENTYHRKGNLTNLLDFENIEIPNNRIVESTGRISNIQESSQKDVCQESSALTEIMNQLIAEVPLEKTRLSPIQKQDHAAMLEDIAQLLQLGFGAEALESIETLKLESLDKRIFRSLANLLEYGQASLDSELQEIIHCDQSPDILKILFGTGDTQISPEVAKSGMLALREFPSDLRQLLAPLVSERLSKSDALELLTDQYNPYSNADENSRAKQGMASLAENTDLHSILVEIGGLSNSNMIEAFDTKLRLEGSFSTEDMELLDSELYVTAEDRHIDELIRVKIELLLENGDFYQLARLFEETEIVTLQKIQPLINVAYDQIVRKSSDITFLEILYLSDNKYDNLLNGEIISKISERESALSLSKPTGENKASSEGMSDIETALPSSQNEVTQQSRSSIRLKDASDPIRVTDRRSTASYADAARRSTELLQNGEAFRTKIVEDAFNQ